MGPVGVQEMIVIFLVALVLFGPKKLPELGRTIGKAISEFRRAQSELKATFETHMRELEKESESIKEITRGYTNEISQGFTGNYEQYDSPYSESGHNYNYGSDSHTSTAANPSTVSASATQGAEATVSHEKQLEAGHENAVNGTVPRNPYSEAPSEPAAHSHPEPETHANG
jgi:sec-independent protein translocase protein TatA